MPTATPSLLSDPSARAHMTTAGLALVEQGLAPDPVSIDVSGRCPLGHMGCRREACAETAGILEEVPRTPEIFEEQVKWKLSLSPFDMPQLAAATYASLEEHKDAVRKQFEEEQSEGLMKAYSRAEFD